MYKMKTNYFGKLGLNILLLFYNLYIIDSKAVFTPKISDYFVD